MHGYRGIENSLRRAPDIRGERRAFSDAAALQSQGECKFAAAAFVAAIETDENARLIGDTLEKLEVVPVLDEHGVSLATHAVALTWETDSGVEQAIELFERAADAEAARERHEQAFANGKAGRLIAFASETTSIIAPISEGDAAFDSYMNAVEKLKRD